MKPTIRKSLWTVSKMNRRGYSNLNDTNLLPTANDETFDPAHQPNEPAAIAMAIVPEAMLLVATP